MTVAAKTIFRKAAALVIGLCTFCGTGISAGAAQTQQGAVRHGDVNCDGAVTHEDAEMLIRHLTGEAPLKDLSAAANADMNSNGIVNVTDLSAMKRLILSGSEHEPQKGHPAGSSDPGASLPEFPLQPLNPAMCSVGEQRILLVAVSFPDCKRTDGLTAEQIQERCFGAADPQSSAYPMESISAFYERASYGRLKITGDVYTYDVPEELSTYLNKPDKLVDAVLAGLDAEIDYRTYDADGDGVMNPVIIALPNAAGNTDWGPVCGKFSLQKTFDGTAPAKRCIGCAPLDSQPEFNRIWIHELGHTMGLPDYYKFTNTQNGRYGLNGDAGWEMLDDANGDFSAFSKLMYGWIPETEVQIYQGGTQTFRLESSQAKPGCIVIPRGELNGLLSEFFVIEYATDTENNQGGFTNRKAKTLFTGGGVRVLHCDAEVYDSTRGTEFKWYNYSKYYDSSNEKQRVIRLANEAEGGRFFGAGDTVDGNISGFRWYDEDGGQTVGTGLRITVDSIADGVCNVTIRPEDN